MDAYKNKNLPKKYLIVPVNSIHWYIIARTLPMTDFQLGFAEVLIQPMVLLLLGFNTNYKDYLITAMKCQNIELQLNWILLFWNNLFEIWSQLRSAEVSKLTLSRLQDHWVEGWAGCSTWIYEGPWKYQINKKSPWIKKSWKSFFWMKQS